ncbi:MAG: serine/threonine-protein kinase [Myxococcota bacterium]
MASEETTQVLAGSGPQTPPSPSPPTTKASVAGGDSASSYGQDTLERIEARVRQRLLSAGSASTRIGRYRLLEPIGRGGMGAVYTAYDEQLDRKVALKTLLPEQLPSERIRLRFLREAQAQARLSHPNVVTVHEVGESNDEVFLAMEYVHGQSVREWLKSEPAWTEVLDVFVRAGRGVMAAHDAGLIHRDLKPANIMRNDDGVVKVLDFGLARLAEYEDESTEGALPVSASSSLSSNLTQSNVIMGTPAYMAPEQLEGRPLDPRSDQYSFCVALWEGLTGTRPFGGEDVDGQLKARLDGPPAWPSDAPPVPRAITDALRKGLAVDADARWPSMAHLLTVLDRDSARGGRKWVAGFGVATVAVIVGAGVNQWAQDRAERCAGATTKLAAVWDDANRTRVQTAVANVDRPYAASVWTRTEAALDDYADAWSGMHTEACEATTVRREQSGHAMDLRIACLDRSLVEFGAVVETLADADTKVVDRAHVLMTELPELSRCADIEALEADVAPPADADAQTVERARQRVARARSERLAGRFKNARVAIEEAEQLLTDVDYGPASSERALEQGHILTGLGEYEAAVGALTQSVTLASESRQWDVLRRALAKRMYVIGVRRQQPEVALHDWPLVLALAKHDPVAENQARSKHSSILRVQEKYKEAETELRTVLASRQQLPGTSPLSLADAHRGLGAVLQMQGRSEEAEVELRAALELSLQSVDADHLTVATARNNLGNVLAAQGKLEDALSEYRQAIESELRSLGSDSPRPALARVNMANALVEMKRYDEAETELNTALAVLEKTMGADHPAVADVWRFLARLLTEQGRFEEATVHARAAVEGTLKRVGPGHPAVATARTDLGTVLRAQGRTAEAEQELRAALKGKLEALGPDHPTTGLTRTELVLVLMQQEKYAEVATESAVTLEHFDDHTDPDMRLSVQVVRTESLLLLGRHQDALTLAWKNWDERNDDEPPVALGDKAFLLALVTWTIDGPGRDREQAESSAERAREYYRSAGDSAAGRLRRVEQWLTAPHDLRSPILSLEAVGL